MAEQRRYGTSIKAGLLASVASLCILALGARLCAGQEKPEETLTVAELLDAPVYDTEVKIYREVGLLEELLCPCFELSSGGQTPEVWCDLMVENDGTERPAVNVKGISNGDRIIVTGELKGEGGTHYSKGDFWAKVIVVPLR